VNARWSPQTALMTIAVLLADFVVWLDAALRLAG
jgi:hypothetical protein